MTTAAALAVLVAAAGVVLRWLHRRTVFVPMRMSDAWIKAHVADPLPDHLR